MRTLRRTVVAALAAGLLSTGVIGSAAAAPITNHVWYTSASQNINHWQTITQSYYCPAGQHIGNPDSVLADAWANYSSSGVSVAPTGGGYGSDYVTLTFTNWNWWGDQTFGIAYVCH